jgi:phosphoglycolate phosphatase
VKYILFDFDGTLAISAEVYMHAWNTYAPVYRYLPVKMEDLQETRHLTIHERAKKFHFPMHKLAIILPKIYRYFNEHVADVPLYDGIKEMLEKLAQMGYKIVILSSNAKENIELILEKEKIEVVTEVLTSKRLFGKDTVIKKFMKKRGVTAGELLYIGDELRDIQACNKLGVAFMWVSWGLDGYELIQGEKPKYIAHTPAEIVEHLK